MIDDIFVLALISAPFIFGFDDNETATARLRLLMGQCGAAAHVAAYAVVPGPSRAVAALFTIYGDADVLRPSQLVDRAPVP